MPVASNEQTIIIAINNLSEKIDKEIQKKQKIIKDPFFQWKNFFTDDEKNIINELIKAVGDNREDVLQSIDKFQKLLINQKIDDINKELKNIKNNNKNFNSIILLLYLSLTLIPKNDQQYVDKIIEAFDKKEVKQLFLDNVIESVLFNKLMVVKKETKKVNISTIEQIMLALLVLNGKLTIDEITENLMMNCKNKMSKNKDKTEEYNLKRYCVVEFIQKIIGEGIVKIKNSEKKQKTKKH